MADTQTKFISLPMDDIIIIILFIDKSSTLTIFKYVASRLSLYCQKWFRNDNFSILNSASIACHFKLWSKTRLYLEYFLLEILL